MFKSSLEQERIFEEIKNGTGNLLINALAGTGKCLGKGTNVLMYDGYFKNVEDIVVGDLLMGDDGTPRTVLNTNIGNDILYKIMMIRTRESFICNGDHILTCLLTYKKENFSSHFAKKDISVNDLINNEDYFKPKNNNIVNGHNLFRAVLDYTGSEVKDFYKYGFNFFNKKNIEYKDILTSRENRFLILSGIVDRYCFPMKNILVLNEKYSKYKNIWIFRKLVRSLGFRLDFRKNHFYIRDGEYHKLTLNNEIYEYFFSGKNREKKNSIFGINKEPFSINELPEKGDYYGFTLDGNGRFIIEDYIVTHNTTTIVKSLELISEDKRVLMLAFNKHIANELKEKLPKRDNLWISTTHALGWGAIRKKYKNAVIDDNKAYRVINSKLPRWNMSQVDNVEEYVSMIKKLVDLCRVTLTLERRFVTNLAKNHGYQITDEDGRRVLSVIEEMYNDTNTFDFIDMVYIPAIDKKIWLFPNDYVFVDECVSGNNNIITKQGPIRFKTLYKRFVLEKKSWMSQQDIPKALSYNMVTDEYEYKNITNIEYKGRKKVTYIDFKKYTVYSTPSHLYYTSEGWRETKDLNIGDAIKVNGSHLKTCIMPNKDQLDIINVMFLNDYFYSKELNIAKFRFYINNNNIGYFNLVSNLLDFKIKSFINSYYTEYATVPYYYNSKLTDKEYLISKINNKQLALLLMRRYFIDENEDLGFGFKSKNYDNALYYKDLFEKSTGIKFKAKLNKKMYYFIPLEMDKFMQRVGKFITEDFKEHFPEKYHEYIEGYEYKKPLQADNYITVRDIKHNIIRKDVYDVTVEDNHNYFVMGVSDFSKLGSLKWRMKRNNVGILSHNCQDYNRAQQFILNKVVKKDAGRLVSVGDNHQCQPAGTKVLLYNGIEKNIEDIVEGDRVVTYNRKDFTGFNGDIVVEEKAQRIYNDKLIVIESNGKLTKYTKNHRCFVRYNPFSVNYDNKIFEIKAIDINKDDMQMVHIYNNNVEFYDINTLSYEDFNGYVYSLKVEKYEAYIADGILTHNSIYYFNGSDSNAFNWFREKENTKVLPLTTSYRCSKNVIRHAQNIVPNINHKVDAVEGSVRNGSVLEEAQSGDFVLSRTNKPLVVLLFDLLRRNKNASIRGNDIGITISKTVNKYKNLVDLNTGLTNLLTEKSVQLLNMGVSDVFNDPRYIAVQDTVDIIRFLMNNSKTIGEILTKLPYIFTDNPKGIILSTIHKSKGLEADNVFIIKPDKLKIPTKIPEMWQQEINLEYIAYTRAKVNLIIDNDWTDEQENR
jgi:hypothetical protein